MFGINISGAEFGSGTGRYGWDYIYPSSQTIQYYAGKGFDTIRLPVKWERLQHDLNGPLDTQELGRIRAVLDMAQASGMKVVLDIHNYAYYDGGTIGTEAVPISSFADLWGKIAGELGSHTAIDGYGLMNEPIGFSDTQTWPDAAQAAINAIRAVDTDTAIYVAGQNWGSAMNWPENNDNLKYLRDPSDRLVFEAHQYFDRWNSGTYQGTYDSEGAHAEIGVERLQPFLNWLKENNLKGFIGEYAVPDNDPRWLTVIDNFLAELAEHGVPSAYWGGGPWWGGYPMSIEPENGADAPQMAILLKNIAAYEAYMAKLEAEAAIPAPPPLFVLDGTAGGDTLTGKEDIANELRGLKGDDVLQGGTLNDTLHGDEGNDTLHGGGGGDLLYGGAGNDYFYGGEGDDTLDGADGDDRMYGGAGNDRMTGGNGRDHFWGDDGDDHIDGGNGDDLLYGGHGNDIMVGGTGNDVIHSNNGDDELHGGDHDDRLYSSFGNDVLYGERGNDQLFGDQGDDVLSGGAGWDALKGGAGADVFVFDAGSAFEGTDTILDFSLREGDRIDLSSLLSQYDPVTQAIADFVQLTSVGADSVLSVDIDGGGDRFVQIATIKGVTGITDEQALVASGHLIVS